MHALHVVHLTLRYVHQHSHEAWSMSMSMSIVICSRQITDVSCDEIEMRDRVCMAFLYMYRTCDAPFISLFSAVRSFDRMHIKVCNMRSTAVIRNYSCTKSDNRTACCFLYLMNYCMIHVTYLIRYTHDSYYTDDRAHRLPRYRSKPLHVRLEVTQ